MINCPICRQKLTVKYSDTLDGWCLMEEFRECPAGHFSYQYETGYTTLIIRGVESLSYGYSSPPSKLDESLYSFRLFVARLLYRIETFLN